MRKSSFAPGILFLIFALTLPVLIIAQQTRSARRTTTPDRPTTTGGTASGKALDRDAVFGLRRVDAEPRPRGTIGTADAQHVV